MFRLCSLPRLEYHSGMESRLQHISKAVGSEAGAAGRVAVVAAAIPGFSNLMRTPKPGSIPQRAFKSSRNRRGRPVRES